MTTTDDQITMLQKQQQLQTQAIKAFLEGKLDGPGSAKGFLLALDPNLTVDPAPFAIGE